MADNISVKVAIVMMRNAIDNSKEKLKFYFLYMTLGPPTSSIKLICFFSRYSPPISKQ